MKTLTIQDLKENRQEIIDYCNEKNNTTGNYVDLKKFMTTILLIVQDGMVEISEDETVMDFVAERYDFMRPRSRKTSRVAEQIGKLQEDEKIERYTMNYYMKNR